MYDTRTKNVECPDPAERARLADWYEAVTRKSRPLPDWPEAPVERELGRRIVEVIGGRFPDIRGTMTSGLFQDYLAADLIEALRNSGIEVRWYRPGHV